MNSKEKFAIDISHWRNQSQENIIRDTASFALEASQRDLKKRVNAVVLQTTQFGQLVKEKSQEAEDLATLKIFQWANEDIPRVKLWVKDSSSNQEILTGMADFADQNPGTAMIWLSPPLEGAYKETRLVIYQTIEVNGQKYLFFRAICSHHTAEECLKIAHKLTPFLQKNISPPIFGTGDLRATPLPLSLPKEQTLTEFFSSIVDLPQVWKTIAAGEDLKEKVTALQVAKEIVSSHHQQIELAQSFYDQLLVGQQIEMELQKKMQLILQSGPCGVLYSNLLGSNIAGVLGTASFNLPILSGETKKFVRRCGNCGILIMDHISKGYRCKCCGGTYEGC